MNRIARLPVTCVLALAVILGNPQGALAQDEPSPSAAGGDLVTLVACIAREADHARAVAGSAASSTAALLLVDGRSGVPSYVLTGTREPLLTEHLGARVEISGTVERARTTPVLTAADGTRTGSVNTGAVSATGVTPGGGAAHEPADALVDTISAGPVSAPVTTGSDPAYRIATLPRLNATAFRRVPGTCAPPATFHSAGPTPQPSPAAVPPSPVVRPAAETHVTARGCLARQTPGGTALTPQDDAGDTLVLTNASLSAESAAVLSAVPGSVPSGSGSGTVPGAAATAGAPTDAGRLTFALVVTRDEHVDLAKHVGQRVEVVGLGAGETAGGGGAVPAEGAGTGRSQSATADTAHPSAPAQRISVTAFRPLGGACR